MNRALVALLLCALGAAAGCAARHEGPAPVSPGAGEAGSLARESDSTSAKHGSRASSPAAPSTGDPSRAASESARGPRPGVDWPSFRGIDASGVSEGAPLPVTWSAESGGNVAWKTPVPGLGHSGPVVWGDRLFVTTAAGTGDAPLKVGLYGDIAPVPDEGAHRFVVYALDKGTGRILWERVAHTGVPAVKRHTKSSHANPTPATDGRHLAVFFGSEGLYLYDLEGNLKWKKDLGVLDSGYFMAPQAQWAFGSSPVLHDGLVIVQVDVQGGGYLAAFRAADGSEAWRTPRADVPTWSTPAVIRTESGTQIVVNGWKHIGGYDAATGREVWRMKGGGDIPVPTPVMGHGLIFITNAHGGPAPVFAIRPGAAGEISADADGAPTGPHVAWAVMRGGAYMQTPLVYGDHLYVCRDNGELSVYDPRTGQVLHKQRLGGVATGFTASGVAGDGKLYYSAESGAVFVVRAGAQPEVLSTNEMAETLMATPAISEGMLFFRTRGHVVAIKETPGAQGASGGPAAGQAAPRERAAGRSFSRESAAEPAASRGPAPVSIPTQDGGVVHADLYGGGERGVVLAHGGRFNKESWDKEARALAAAGFRVLAIDFRGYGRSQGPGDKDPLGAPLHLDVLAAVRYLKRAGAKTVSVVGGSMGGGAAGDAAIEADPGEIDRLVFLGSGASLAGRPPEQVKGRKLFIIARDDLDGQNRPRLTKVREQYERAPDPKELVVLEGSAHAQFIFATDQGERLMREILTFLARP